MVTSAKIYIFVYHNFRVLTLLERGINLCYTTWIIALSVILLFHFLVVSPSKYSILSYIQYIEDAFVYNQYTQLKDDTRSKM